MDILSEGAPDERIITFHRFQIVVWTRVLGTVFVSNVVSELVMPAFRPFGAHGDQSEPTWASSSPTGASDEHPGKEAALIMVRASWSPVEAE